MFEQNSFRISCRSAGVAKHAGIALVARHPSVVSVLRGEQRKIIGLETDEMLDAGQVRLQSFDG